MIDVIVIGAGPAGTACAKKLAKNGVSVKVFDKRAEIGAPKRCGEGLSEASQKFVGKIPERCIAQKMEMYWQVQINERECVCWLCPP